MLPDEVTVRGAQGHQHAVARVLEAEVHGCSDHERGSPLIERGELVVPLDLTGRGVQAEQATAEIGDVQASSGDRRR